MLHQKEKKNPQWCERQKDKDFFLFENEYLQSKTNPCHVIYIYM